MARLAAFAAGAVLTCFACGGEPAALDIEGEPLMVAAVPPSSSFEGVTTVSLESSRPATIYYSLKGEDPFGEDGHLYTGPIEIADSTLVTFIAIGHDGVWSQPGTELYSPVIPLIPPDPIPRSLSIDRDAYFFTVPDEHEVTTTFLVRSIGFEPVHIERAFIGAHPDGSGFYEEGIFKVETEIEPMELNPGEQIEIEVSYVPTQTLRGGALIIESNSMRHEEGYVIVQLWGRTISW
jgi:hypothetical protein